MKEFEVIAAKAHQESIHNMKVNAVYVNKTEIYGYLSVLGENLESEDMPLVEGCNERHSAEVNEFADIMFPLYKNYLTGSSSRNTSQTKCNRTYSRTSVSTRHSNDL